MNIESILNTFSHSNASLNLVKFNNIQELFENINLNLGTPDFTLEMASTFDPLPFQIWFSSLEIDSLEELKRILSIIPSEFIFTIEPEPDSEGFYLQLGCEVETNLAICDSDFTILKKSLGLGHIDEIEVEIVECG